MCSSCFLICFPAVAVGAANFALLYLGNDALQREAPTGRFTYIKVLVASVVVVELQYDRVALAAVYAVVGLQVLQQPCPDTSSHRVGMFTRTGFYLSLIGLVVPLLC